MSQSHKDQFLEAYKAATIPVLGKEQRLLGDARIELVGETDTGFKLADNEVYLSDLRVETMQQGIGTKTMQFLSTLADRFNVDIVLHAMGTTDEGPADWKLKDFYKGFGFKKVGPNNEMYRPAGAETAVAEPAPKL